MADRINYSDIKNIQDKTNAVLSKTGQTFTWSSSIVQKSRVDYVNAEDVRNAIDLAYDHINRGCSAHRGTVNTDNITYSPSSYTGDNSSYNSSVNGSNFGDFSDDSSFDGHRGSDNGHDSSFCGFDGSDFSGNNDHNGGWNADEVSNDDHGFHGPCRTGG